MAMPGKQLTTDCILTASMVLAICTTCIFPVASTAQQGSAAAGTEENQTETGALKVAEGKTMHVRDQIFVPFRTGPTNQYRIIRFLPTGAQLETRRPDDEAIEKFGKDALEDWIYGTHNNDEGWVQAQYMVSQPPAKMRIGNVEAELESAEEEIATLEQELANTEADKQELTEQLTQARQRITELEEKLQTANEGYQLVQANEKLKERVRVLIDRAEELEERNQKLTERAKRDWFLAGAGVLVGGLLLGLLLPHLRPRRKGWGNSL